MICKSSYTGPVQAVVLDWAGTAVDYGCMGPAAVFVAAFQQFDIEVSISQARQFMGLEKKDHIRAMTQLPQIRSQWRKKKGKAPDEADVQAVYSQTEPMMVEAIANHCAIIDGTLDFAAEIRRRNIKIGSSTGYTRPMVDALVPLAAQQGYTPDAVVCSSDVPAGRPFPWMCYLNAIELNVYPMAAMVKIGDTISDIEEGLNAGMWTIGLTQSGNELGLTAAQAARLSDVERTRQLEAIRKRYETAGAHYVAAGIWECIALVDAIATRLSRGERP